MPQLEPTNGPVVDDVSPFATPAVDPADLRTEEDTEEDPPTMDTQPVLGELPPTSPEDIDLSVEDIVRRADRTDDHLRRWRQESVDRRAAWDVEEAERMELDARRQASFRLGAALGLAGAVAATVMALWAVGQRSAVEAPVVAPPVAAEVPVVAEPVAEPVVEAVAEPVVEAVAPVAEAPAAIPPAPPAPPAGALDVTGVKTWSTASYAWAVADVARDDVELAWFDAAGAEALDRVACNVRVADGWQCKSGRSVRRITHALGQGAQPGTWTVKACQGGACSDLGTFEVPLR